MLDGLCLIVQLQKCIADQIIQVQCGRLIDFLVETALQRSPVLQRRRKVCLPIRCCFQTPIKANLPAIEDCDQDLSEVLMYRFAKSGADFDDALKLRMRDDVRTHVDDIFHGGGVRIHDAVEYLDIGLVKTAGYLLSRFGETLEGGKASDEVLVETTLGEVLLIDQWL